MMMRQYRFINCNIYTTLIEMLIMEEAVPILGQKLYGKYLFLLFDFIVNLKLI